MRCCRPKLTRGEVKLRAPAQLAWLDAPTAVPNIWLADVRADGLIAFREHAAVTLRKEAAGKELARIKRFRAATTPMPAPRNFAPHSRRRCSRKGCSPMRPKRC